MIFIKKRPRKKDFRFKVRRDEMNSKIRLILVAKIKIALNTLDK